MICGKNFVILAVHLALEFPKGEWDEGIQNRIYFKANLLVQTVHCVSSIQVSSTFRKGDMMLRRICRRFSTVVQCYYKEVVIHVCIFGKFLWVVSIPICITVVSRIKVL